MDLPRGDLPDSVTPSRPGTPDELAHGAARVPERTSASPTSTTSAPQPRYSATSFGPVTPEFRDPDRAFGDARHEVGEHGAIHVQRCQVPRVDSEELSSCGGSAPHFVGRVRLHERRESQLLAILARRDDGAARRREQALPRDEFSHTTADPGGFLCNAGGRRAPDCRCPLDRGELLAVLHGGHSAEPEQPEPVLGRARSTASNTATRHGMSTGQHRRGKGQRTGHRNSCDGTNRRRTRLCATDPQILTSVGCPGTDLRDICTDALEGPVRIEPARRREPGRAGRRTTRCCQRSQRKRLPTHAVLAARQAAVDADGKVLRPDC